MSMRSGRAASRSSCRKSRSAFGVEYVDALGQRGKRHRFADRRRRAMRQSRNHRTTGDCDVNQGIGAEGLDHFDAADEMRGARRTWPQMFGPDPNGDLTTRRDRAVNRDAAAAINHDVRVAFALALEK